MVSTSLENIKDNVDRPEKASDFQMRYEKYLKKVNIFFSRGQNWTQPLCLGDKIADLRFIDSYQQFEEWLLMEKTNLRDLNVIHEKWVLEGVHRGQIAHSQAVKIGHWLEIFFQYNNFKTARPIVSSLY